MAGSVFDEDQTSASWQRAGYTTRHLATPVLSSNRQTLECHGQHEIRRQCKLQWRRRLLHLAAARITAVWAARVFAIWPHAVSRPLVGMSTMVAAMRRVQLPLLAIVAEQPQRAGPRVRPQLHAVRPRDRRCCSRAALGIVRRQSMCIWVGARSPPASADATPCAHALAPCTQRRPAPLDVPPRRAER